MLFDYTATDAQGKITRSTIESFSMREAVQNLRAKGMIITSVRPAKLKKSFGAGLVARLNRVSSMERVMITRHLALLLRAGVTVDRSLDIISRQQKKKFLRDVLRDVLESVRKGESLAAALGKHATVFPRRYVAMVQWGEAGGSLGDSLEQLAGQLEHDRELMGKVKGALTYPALIVCVMVVVGVLMSMLVLPQLISIVESFGIELPLPTRIFLAVAKFMSGYSYYVLPALVVAVGLMVFLLRLKRFKPYVHLLLIKLPVFGKIVKMVNLARMNRALGSLIHSGIPIIDAITIASEVLGNEIYKRALLKSAGEIKRGVQLGGALRPHKKIFPSMETDMIQVGEESGKLADVLQYLAKFYEDEVNNATKNMAQLIEPILMVVVGIVVGGIVFAVLMPIYNLGQAIV